MDNRSKRHRPTSKRSNLQQKQLHPDMAEFQQWWQGMVENRKKLRKKRPAPQPGMTLAERIALQREQLTQEETDTERKDDGEADESNDKSQPHHKYKQSSAYFSHHYSSYKDKASSPSPTEPGPSQTAVVEKKDNTAHTNKQPRYYRDKAASPPTPAATTVVGMKHKTGRKNKASVSGKAMTPSPPPPQPVGVSTLQQKQNKAHKKKKYSKKKQRSKAKGNMKIGGDCNGDASTPTPTMGGQESRCTPSSVAIHQSHHDVTNSSPEQRTLSNAKSCHEISFIDGLTRDNPSSMTSNKSLNRVNSQSEYVHKQEQNRSSSSDSDSSLSMDNIEQRNQSSVMVPKELDAPSFDQCKYKTHTKGYESNERISKVRDVISSSDIVRHKSKTGAIRKQSSRQKQSAPLPTVDLYQDRTAITDESSSSPEETSPWEIDDINRIDWDYDEQLSSMSSGTPPANTRLQLPLLSSSGLRQQQLARSTGRKPFNHNTNINLPIIEERPSVIDSFDTDSQGDSLPISERVSLPSIRSRSNSVVSRSCQGTHNTNWSDTPSMRSPARWPNSVYKIPRHLRHLGDDFDTLMSFPHTQSHLPPEAQVRVSSLPNTKSQDKIAMESPRVRSSPSAKHRTRAYSTSCSTPRLLNRFKDQLRIQQLENEVDASLQDIFTKYPLKSI